MNDATRALLQTSPLHGANAPYVEELYERWIDHPESVSPAWREWFAALVRDAGADPRNERPHRPILHDLEQRARQPRVAVMDVARDHRAVQKQGAVSRMIQVYANRGHLVADIDPLRMMERHTPRVLDLAYFGLDESDLEETFFTGSRTPSVPARMKLRDIVHLLKQVYCGRIGAEFAHVSSSEERLWLQDAFQEGRMAHRFAPEERRNILWQLTAAEGLERYLHTRYVGQKRFSLEGGDALMPLIDDLIQQCGADGVDELIIGMAHRGRLNVLVNSLGKAPSKLFDEFEGNYDLAKLKGSGDVKYHKGYSADIRTPGGNVHVVLAFNPSHLEVVNPVVEGSVRARQERRDDAAGDKVVPVLIHGDSAFGGQGVVMETFQLSQARGFYTGGTVHLIVNNQVGFTTSDPRDTRSTLYCSDVAKMVEAPIFHVNGDDPEAVVFAARLALGYRMKFHKDVVIDLVCYRRHGHNEADEPSATQPVMYQVIRKHPTPRQIYAQQLESLGVVQAGEADAMVAEYRQGLDEGKPQARAALGLIGNKYTVDWTPFLDADPNEAPYTGVPVADLKRLGERVTHVPEAFTLHPRVQKIVEDRRKMYRGEQALDWGAAEMLGYATLLDQGHPIRLVGQDAGRGTFFHRHAVFHDQATARTHVTLARLADRQPKFTVIDSVLSEEAVLGFEYGFSTTDPTQLVIWEGQFGDFANGAQVIIDQFISSGETKWGRLCGLALFLPHGYEGQGPEHSSARLERFLQLCAENNMTVCVPSTPAQMYHMVRRQQVRALRRPLVVMTPKSLLRHKLAVSALDELARGRFQLVIDETDVLEVAKVKRVVFCSGKVYYDLLEHRRSRAQQDVAIVRIEQLYPFPVEEYKGILDKYAAATEIVWCQEEPQNQGAWYQIRHRLQDPMGSRQELFYAGRRGAAAPATGIGAIHNEEQTRLVAAAIETHSADGERQTPRTVGRTRRK